MIILSIRKLDSTIKQFFSLLSCETVKELQVCLCHPLNQINNQIRFKIVCHCFAGGKKSELFRNMFIGLLIVKKICQRISIIF